MKRFILPLFSLIVFSLVSNLAFSQNSAMEGKITHNKSSKVAAVREFPYPIEEVHQAIRNMMAEKGQKPDKSKDFLVFRNSTLHAHANELHDLHFKVERKGRKEKNSSMVYLIVGRPSENIGLRTESDRHKVEEGKELLNSLVPHIEKQHLSVQITQQSGGLDKMRKSLKSLESGQVDNEKRLKQLQDKIAKSKQEQERLRVEIAREEEVLNAMKGRQIP